MFELLLLFGYDESRSYIIYVQIIVWTYVSVVLGMYT